MRSQRLLPSGPAAAPPLTLRSPCSPHGPRCLACWSAMDASLVTGWFESLARALGGFPDPEAVQQAWAATQGLVCDQGGLGEQAEQALAPPATARLVRCAALPCAHTALSTRRRIS